MNSARFQRKSLHQVAALLNMINVVLVAGDAQNNIIPPLETRPVTLQKRDSTPVDPGLYIDYQNANLIIALSAIGGILFGVITVFGYVMCTRIPSPSSKLGGLFSSASQLFGLSMSDLSPSQKQPAPQPQQTTYDPNRTMMPESTLIEGHNSTIIDNNNAVLALPGFLEVDPSKDFKLVVEIAKGGMGSVWKCQLLNENLIQELRDLRVQDPTVAVVKQSIANLKGNKLHAFEQEVSMMYFLKSSSNIARILGFSREPIRTIVMQFYPLGSLDKFLSQGLRGISYDTQLVFNLIHGVARGLLAMHRRMIAHRDLKPANIMLDYLRVPNSNRMLLKPLLTDFGISEVVDPESLRVKNFHLVEINGLSMRYAPPEMILRFRKVIKAKPTTTSEALSVDVYAFSATLCEILTRRLPWAANRPSPAP